MYGVNLVLFGLIFGLVIIPEVRKELLTTSDSVEAYHESHLYLYKSNTLFYKESVIHFKFCAHIICPDSQVQRMEPNTSISELTGGPYIFLPFILL